MGVMNEQLLEHERVRLAWRERPGPGIPVVFLSGGPGMPDYLGDVSDLLTDRWVVRYDQRGTGASVARDDDYSCAAHIGDLELLRQNLGVEKIALFGHSWGGVWPNSTQQSTPTGSNDCFSSARPPA